MTQDSLDAASLMTLAWAMNTWSGTDESLWLPRWPEVVQEAVGGTLMLGIPDEILRESGLPGHRRDELLVVEGDTQLLRQLLGDEPPAGTVLPADGDDNVLHKDTSYPDFIIIQTRRFVKADFQPQPNVPPAEYLEGSTVSMAILSTSPFSHRRSRSSASAYTSAPVTSTPLAST